MAGIWFNYLTSSGRFYVSAFFNLAGLVLTILFVRPAPPHYPYNTIIRALLLALLSALQAASEVMAAQSPEHWD